MRWYIITQGGGGSSYVCFGEYTPHLDRVICNEIYHLPIDTRRLLHRPEIGVRTMGRQYHFSRSFYSWSAV